MWQPALTLGREIHEKGENRALTNNYLLAIAEFFKLLLFSV